MPGMQGLLCVSGCAEESLSGVAWPTSAGREARGNKRMRWFQCTETGPRWSQRRDGQVPLYVYECAVDSPLLTKDGHV
jgi:hypothetical protein